MKENFWYKDPLAVGHTAADRILEKKQREAELTEADLRSEEDKLIENVSVKANEDVASLENINENIDIESENNEKENPSEEYYGRFEQFRGVKKDSDVYKKNGKVNNNKKKSGKRKPYNDLQVFDPYK